MVPGRCAKNGLSPFKDSAKPQTCHSFSNNGAAYKKGSTAAPSTDAPTMANYNIRTKTVTEWNVGCEKCHGPGSEHVQHPTGSNIVNPAREGYVPASDVCIQCHSQGRPLENPISGKYYDWPVGYDVTRKLSDFWKLEDHKLGETSFTHFG